MFPCILLKPIMQSPQTEIVLGNGLGLAVTIGFELADEACVGE